MSTVSTCWYQYIQQIDRNGFVYKGKILKSHYKFTAEQNIAVKHTPDIFDTNYKQKLLKELDTLYLLKNHDCIVKLHHIIFPEDQISSFNHLILIQEYVDADLSKIFRTDQYFTKLHVEYILYKILCGLKYIHSAGIIHLNLCPSNILINSNCSIKISDFKSSIQFDINHRNIEKITLNEINEIRSKIDFSSSNKSEKQVFNAYFNYLKQKKQRPPDIDKFIDFCKNKKHIQNVNHSLCQKLIENIENNMRSKDEYNRELIGRSSVYETIYNCAPEVILKTFESNKLCKIDIWSVGCIFFELLLMKKQICPKICNRAPLFNDGQHNDIKTVIQRTGKPDNKIIYGVYKADSDEIDLLKHLLKFDADLRYNVNEALNHGYFYRVRDKKDGKNFNFDKCESIVHIPMIECDGKGNCRQFILESIMRINKNKNEEEKIINSKSMKIYVKLRLLLIEGFCKKYSKSQFIPFDVVLIIINFFCSM